MAALHFDGADYEFVKFSDFTIEEAMILYDYAKLNLDEVEDAGFHAGAIAALIHVSVTRANPRVNQKMLKQKVVKVPMAQLEQVFADISVEVPDEEVEERPPVSASGTGKTPADASATGNDGSASETGMSGSNGSASSASDPLGIGSRGLANGSGSDPETSPTSPISS